MEQFNINQFKAKFLEEANDLLDKLDNSIIVLEQQPGDKPSIEQAFRIMHTLKGVSSMYGFDRISEVTHQMEDIYDRVREGKLEVTTALCDLTLEICDHIRNLLTDETGDNRVLGEQQKRIIDATSRFVKQAEAAAPESPKASESAMTNTGKTAKRTWLVLFYPSEEIMRRGINLVATLHDLGSLGSYHIQPPVMNESQYFWPIYLVSDKSSEDIEDVLMFVLDYFKVTLIADLDIFDSEKMNSRLQFLPNAVSPGEKIMQLESNTFLPQASDDIKKDAAKQSSLKTSRITVDSTKLDTLMYLVSELVTTKSELAIAIETDNKTKTEEAAEKIDKLSKLFRENALDIRLVSLHDLLLRFNRLIRDLSHSLGKSIEFDTTGQDTELDKNIIDTIAEPIMHLIRNCIDHGIESPDERVKQGKPEVGHVKFMAYKSGNFVFIQISDDGRGISYDKVRQKAIDLGIITDTQSLCEKDAWELIFRPGFSTAETLTQVSGRGVGMDIVKKKIEEVRGEISIDSISGVGTTFTIKIQQTIAIIDTLLVKCGTQKYAIPLEDVENCELIDQRSLDKSANKQVVYNKELIPYINLHNELSIKTSVVGKQKMIVLNKNDKKYAIITDEIVGEYQAVIKPLGSTFKEQNFLSGASILGDGSIALLLDTDKMKALMCG